MLSTIKRKPVSGSITYSKVAQAAHSLSGELRSPSDDQRLSSPLSDDRYPIIQDQRPVSPVSANSFSSNLETPSSIYLHNNTNLEAHLIRLPASEQPRLLELTDPRGPGHSSSEARQEKGRNWKYVKWGIHWSQPSYVLLLTVSAIALALGHHFYYKSLNGTSAGSITRQQWSITFGSSFAYLVVHFLGAAIVATYSQYIWSIVRKRGYTLEALDNLFAMTSDPRAFLNWEVLKYGRFAVLLALMTWLMGFASVTPPATLSVVSGFQNETILTPWPSLDWSLPNWVHDQYYFTPSESVLDVATSSANQMQLMSIPPPAPNSTYQMNFYGPSVQCNAANATQQPIFDYYMQALANQSLNATERIHSVIVTQAVVESPDFNETYRSSPPLPSLQPLILSAFSPTETTWYAMEEEVESSGIDQYNNWPVDLPTNWEDTVQFWISTDNGTGPEFSWTTQQLWLQTASQGIVCILGNASYEVGFEYVDGVQSVSQSTNDFTPLFMRTYGNESPDSYYDPAVESYVAVFTALTSLLSGNITMQLDPIETNNGVPGNISLEISTETSKALLTGLIACDDMAPTYWFDNMWQFETGIEKYELLDNSSYVPNDLFNKPSWMCRNRTLAPAIEDLFNNITIGMLGADISGTTNQTIPVSYLTTHNVYQYNSRNLILSYSIAVGVTLFCIIIGTYATITNGVSHSSSFSAIIATTRNPQLDRLVEGSSLGALPLDREMRKTKLKFGELMGDRWEKGGVAGHVGFGFEDNVLNLRRNGKYS